MAGDLAVERFEQGVSQRMICPDGEVSPARHEPTRSENSSGPCQDLAIGSDEVNRRGKVSPGHGSFKNRLGVDVLQREQAEASRRHAIGEPLRRSHAEAAIAVVKERP